LRRFCTTLEREAGPRVAEAYGHKIGLCLERIVEFPGIGTRRPALGADTRIGIVRPYILIYDYTAADDTLTLLRIVHGKRNITRRLIMKR